MKVNPALDRLLVDVSRLRCDPRNARAHDERSISTIATSLSEFGQQKPVVALKDGTVIAGNGTLEAARRLGWKKLAAVTFTDEEKARAFALADNRTGELSKWDNEILSDVLGDLDESFNLAALGFNGFDIRRILGDFEPRESEPEEDEDADEPDEPEDVEPSARQIVVLFDSDEDAREFGKLLGQRVTKKTKTLRFKP